MSTEFRPGPDGELAPVLDINELVQYIFDGLVAQGIAVTHEDIDKVLQLEDQFLIDKGFSIPYPEDEQ